MKVISTAALAVVLALMPLGGVLSTSGATGFHAAYFSESAFLTLGPGQTGQFSVGYTNTGDQPWVKGQSGSQASLHTAAPLDNPIDFTAGWGSNWAAPNIYAIQTNDLVAPGQIGFFTYSVKVPATQAFGAKSFYGRVAIDGVGYLEDYGYYHAVNVAGSITITTITPTSPSTNTKPTLSGSGAAANETVTISDGDGGATVGTAIADATGAWTATLSTGLAAGAHQLYATTPSKGRSAAISYTVSASSGPIVSEAYATALTTVVVNFSTAMTCTSTSGRGDMTNIANFFINQLPSGSLGPSISTSTASTDCTSTTLTLSTSLTTLKDYQVVVYFVTSQAGTVIDSQRNTGRFSVGTPSMSSATARQDGTLVISFDRSMNTANGVSGGNSVLNPNNYSVDNTTAASTTTITCVVGGTNGCVTVQLTFTGGTTSVLGAAGQVRTIKVTNVMDAVSGGQLIAPNPSSRQVLTGS